MAERGQGTVPGERSRRLPGTTGAVAVVVAVAAGVPAAVLALTALPAVALPSVLADIPDLGWVSRADLLVVAVAAVSAALVALLARVVGGGAALLAGVVVMALAHRQAGGIDSVADFIWFRVLEVAGAGAVLAGTAALAVEVVPRWRGLVTRWWAGVLAASVVAAIPAALAAPEAAPPPWRDLIRPSMTLLLLTAAAGVLAAITVRPAPRSGAGAAEQPGPGSPVGALGGLAAAALGAGLVGAAVLGESAAGPIGAGASAVLVAVWLAVAGLLVGRCRSADGAPVGAALPLAVAAVGAAVATVTPIAAGPSPFLEAAAGVPGAGVDGTVLGLAGLAAVVAAILAVRLPRARRLAMGAALAALGVVASFPAGPGPGRSALQPLSLLLLGAGAGVLLGAAVAREQRLVAWFGPALLAGGMAVAATFRAAVVVWQVTGAMSAAGGANGGVALNTMLADAVATGQRVVLAGALAVLLVVGALDLRRARTGPAVPDPTAPDAGVAEPAPPPGPA